jgi:predicted transcriptional regulator
MNPIPYIIQGKNIVVIVDNKPHTITETNIGYSALKDAIREGKWELVPDLISPTKVISKFVKGHLEFIDGVLYEGGEQIHGALADRIYDLYDDGFSVEPMVKFYQNIKLNPSVESANELYGFLEKNSLPITDDGCFMAYKRVNKDYTDCYTGKIDNSIGKIVSMPRESVSKNRDDTCSTGLHFCSVDYLTHFEGARIVIVKVNPKDVVSIPSDHNEQKGRCCMYEVVGEMDVIDALADKLSRTSVYVLNTAEEEFVDVLEEDETDDEDEYKKECAAVRSLGLRQQAKIWNKMTGNTLKKFSDRDSCRRRMYDVVDIVHIVAIAKKLGLIK